MLCELVKPVLSQTQNDLVNSQEVGDTDLTSLVQPTASNALYLAYKCEYLSIHTVWHTGLCVALVVRLLDATTC